MKKEIWKKIPDYPAYEVSNSGRVRSYKKRIGVGYWGVSDKPQKIISPSSNSAGYFGVILRKDNKSKRFFIGALVLAAFVGPKPDGLEVHYLDGDNSNNHLDNLKYATRKEIEAARAARFREHGRGRFNEDDVLYIRTSIAERTITPNELADLFDVNRYVIRQVCTGHTYKNYPGPIVDRLPSTHRSGARSKNKYRGVSKHRGRFRAQIWTGGRGGKSISIGCFDTAIEAARAYDEKAREIFGAFASLNFSDKE